MVNSSAVQKRLEDQLREIEQRLEKIDRDRRRDNNPLDEDWQEQAAVRQNDEVLDGLDAEQHQQATAIRTALERIKSGAYGICSECEGRISEARLNALPHATVCIQCAEKQESGG